MSKKAIFGLVVVLVLFFLIGFMFMSGLTKKMDHQSTVISQLQTKIDSLDAVSKQLMSTCNNPPVVAQPVAPAPAPKKLLRDDVYKIVFSHNKELNDCYKMRLHKASDERRMVVSLVINNDGTVVDAKTLNSDIKNQKVEKCITSLIKNIKFPDFEGDQFRDEIYISFDSRSLI